MGVEGEWKGGGGYHRKTENEDSPVLMVLAWNLWFALGKSLCLCSVPHL